MQHVPGGLVLNNVGVEWGVPGLKHHAPDLAVFAGVRERPQEGTFDLKASGGHALLVIEVTSPNTRHLDVASEQPDYTRTKFRHYAWAGVPLYIVVDVARWGKGKAPPFVGYELTGDGYELLPLNERGWLWVPPVHLWIGTRGTEVVCFDEHGREVRDYAEEQAARLAAEERARELEHRLRQLQSQIPDEAHK
ncbi:MAG: hypothetical protein HC884_12715 [Chloroflexaceae bacterium]|nr:hypothetical protein [Chloroflexaceae bacterium]